MRSVKHTKFLWPILAILCGWIIGMCSVSASKLEDIEAILGIDHNQIAALREGEIVSFEVAEETQKELAVGLGMYLSAQPAQLISFFKRGDLAMVDPDVVKYHEIALNDTNPFKEFMFTLDQEDEARKLLKVRAGNKFNLSTEEIKSFAELKKKLVGWSEVDLITSVSQHYQQILLQRFQKYRKHGLAGVASYARKDKETKPAEELRIAAASSKLLNSFSPDLQKFWINYPTPLPSGTEEHFSWLIRKINDRPTAILSHRLLFTSDTGSLILTRQFFVGHTYNSSQLTLGCLPYRNGSLIFYIHRTSTDQVAGLGNKLKHSMGREKMKEQMIINLNGLRSAIKSSGSH